MIARAVRRMAARLVIFTALAGLCACDDMVDQPKQKVYSPLVGPGEVPPGMVESLSGPRAVPPVTRALLARGQERFRIFCVPCHSELGDGRGMVVQRGFPAPPSYHIDSLREAPPQYFFDVITRGHGAMYSFANRVRPDDRWAIAAYIRALQLSQNSAVGDVPPHLREMLP